MTQNETADPGRSATGARRGTPGSRSTGRPGPSARVPDDAHTFASHGLTANAGGRV